MTCPLGDRTVRSATGEGAATLRHEAAVLRRARHPGVVDLVEECDDGEQVTLVTAAIEGVPLVGSTLRPEELAGFMAVLCTTVADLHDIGITHGAIDADHIVIGQDGRPVLVGFEKASVGRGPERRWPASPEAAADVDALGKLTASLLGPVTTIAGDRSVVAAMRRRLSPGLRPCDALAVVVAEARSDRRRISARVFADALLSAVPAARLPGACGAQTLTSDAQASDEWPPPPMNHRQRTNWIVSRRACLVLATTAVIVVAVAVIAHPSPGRPHLAVVPAAVGPVPVRTAPSVAPTTVAEPSLATVPDPVPPPAHVDYADGVLRMADRRFRVGQPGDLLAVGQWKCDGAETLALARPRTSQIWLFSDWPTGPTPVTATEVGDISGATALRPRHVGPCDELVVDRSAGPPAVLLQRPER